MISQGVQFPSILVPGELIPERYISDPDSLLGLVDDCRPRFTGRDVLPPPIATCKPISECTLTKNYAYLARLGVAKMFIPSFSETPEPYGR